MSDARPPPLYERVKQHLRRGIAAGDWQDGARLPSEHQLMDLFGASRMTVHRALRELSADGVLRRVQGVGTFLRREPPRLALLEITDIAADIAGRGHVHQARVLKLDKVPADAETAAEFSLRLGARLFRSDILHLQDGVPVQREQRLVAPRFAPAYGKQDFTVKTTHAYLQGIAPPTEVEHIVHAVMPGERTAALLEIDPRDPCLRLTRRTWVPGGLATSSILTHPGTRYSIGGRWRQRGL